MVDTVSINEKDIVKEFNGYLKDKKPLSRAEPAKLIHFAQCIGGEFSDNDLKSTQIRRFYNVIKDCETKEKIRLDEGQDKKISEETMAELLFLKPYLTYVCKKNTNNKSIEKLSAILDLLLCKEMLETLDDIKYLVHFYGAIIAYHKKTDIV
jgi:CRISPR type III-A-associated protein Csm2